jgi:very-short-patch-repair endonuclease
MSPKIDPNAEALAWQIRHALGLEAETQWPFQRFWIDVRLPAHKLCIEVDGGIFMAKGAHNTGPAILRDMRKANELMLAGERLLRVTPQQVDNGEALKLVERATTAE